MRATNGGAAAGVVLVVEDDPNLREVFSEVLESEGYRVHVAADGAQALAVLENGATPCVVLLDLRMPTMTGWDLAGRLRSTDRWSEVPIVVVAAHYLVADEARKIGADAWLQKPVSLDRLVAVVDRVCGRGNPP